MMTVLLMKVELKRAVAVERRPKIITAFTTSTSLLYMIEQHHH